MHTLQIWGIKSCHYNPSLNERFLHKNKIVFKWKLSEKYLEAALGAFMDLVKSIKNHQFTSENCYFWCSTAHTYTSQCFTVLPLRTMKEKLLINVQFMALPLRTFAQMRQTSK